MLAGIPQMCQPALSVAPKQTVNLVFEGPGGGSWILAPGADLWTITPDVMQVHHQQSAMLMISFHGAPSAPTGKQVLV